MSKSALTRQELKAQAMLLGKFYDHRDHTFNGFNMEAGQTICADTLEPIPSGTGAFGERKNAVKRGELGAADGPFVIYNK